MRLMGLSGWSGSGKTRLVAALIPELMARGLVVATIKHAHHGFDVDQPGKDSHTHRQAGAREVLVSSARRWALMHELAVGEPEPDLPVLLGHLSACDLVLVEGFKRGPHRKLEVWRSTVGKPMLHPDDPSIVALCYDVDPGPLAVPSLPADDIAGLADLVTREARPYPAA